MELTLCGVSLLKKKQVPENEGTPLHPLRKKKRNIGLKNCLLSLTCKQNHVQSKKPKRVQYEYTLVVGKQVK